MIENSPLEGGDAKPTVTKSDLLPFYHFNFFSEISMRILLGVGILHTLYYSKPFNQKILAIYFLIYCLYRVIGALYFMLKPELKLPKYQKTFIYEILYYVSWILFLIAFYLIQKALLFSIFLPIFVAPVVIVCILKLTLSFGEDVAYIQMPIYHFFESIQILLIVLKFIFPESLGRWYLILLMYIVFSLLLVFVAFLLSVAFLVFFFGMVFGADYFNEKSRAWVFMGISLPLIAKFVSNFMLLISFWVCADNDLLGINPQSNPPHRIVVRTAYMLIISGLLVILSWMSFR